MPETVVHFQIRMAPAIYDKLASWAKEDKLSLNALVVDLLQKALEAQNQNQGEKSSSK